MVTMMTTLERSTVFGESLGGRTDALLKSQLATSTAVAFGAAENIGPDKQKRDT